MGEKTKYIISLPTIIFFGALLIFNFNIISFIPFFAALLHEFGHIFAMKVCGVKISQIKILPFGIDIRKVNSITSYKTDIFISIAGVAVNAILLLICSAFPQTAETEFFAASNFLLIIINIIPIKTLDGGQLLEKIIALKYDIQTAENAVNITSFISILLLGCIAVWVLLNTAYNFSLLLMCIYLFCGIFVK